MILNMGAFVVFPLPERARSAQPERGVGAGGGVECQLGERRADAGGELESLAGESRAGQAGCAGARVSALRSGCAALTCRVTI